VKVLSKIGHYFFRNRAVIACLAFVVLFVAADPRHSMIGHVAVGLGLAIRSWAAGYLGPDARRREFNAVYVVRNGPYRLLKHPLYVGNFFLVAGVLILYNPPRWMGVLYLGLFVMIYMSIILSETDHLRGKPVGETHYRACNLTGEFSTWLVLVFIYVIFFVLLKL
jgi:protein-S-isoprenylcysteine O-methyltransferase Ste14